MVNDIADVLFRGDVLLALAIGLAMFLMGLGGRRP